MSYFKGNDPSKWKSNLSTYQIVDMGEVYKGIGLRLKAYGNNVEKLFTVTPAASPDAIQLGLSGAISLTVNERGELVAETELGPVKFTKPIAYQEIDRKRVYVEVAYNLPDADAGNSKAAKLEQADLAEYTSAGDQGLQDEPEKIPTQLTYRFTVASYDRTKDLIIDPLLASTVFGGESYDRAYSIAIDSGNCVYVTGSTYSTSFPTTNGAYDTSFNDGSYKTDVFISKLDGNLATLLASTFLGGSKEEAGQCIACSSDGKIYVAGYTASSNFPITAGGYDPSFDYGSWDGFISKLNSDLTSMEASTFLGKSGYENIHSMVLLNPNPGGPGTYVFVTGETDSNNFPTTPGAYDTTYNDNGTYRDVFISELDGNLHSLLASTFLGGASNDFAGGIALDSSGNVYVTGSTSSSNFPMTIGAYDTSCNGGDAFVSKLDIGLTSLLASTFLGGSGSDDAYAIAIGPTNVFIGGRTHSSDFPITSGAYDTSFGGSSEAFISKLNKGLTSLKASTYLGGSLDEVVLSIVRHPLDNVLFVSGYTESTDITTANGYDTSHNGSRDIFVAKLSTALDNLMNFTYLGGSNDEWDGRIAIDSNANVFVTGFTYSTNFPTTVGAYDDNLFFYYEIFVSKLDGNL